MDKSQVRRLARAYANGALGAAEYRAERRELLDAIVDGSVAIEREAPPPPPPPPAPDDPTIGAPAHAEAARPNMLPIYGGVGAVILALIVWALWPSEEEPAPPPVAAPAPPVPERQVSEARNLVESFIAERDWSESSVSAFEHSWNQLPEGEQRDAHGESWFRRLSKAIRQEINTQKALAEIDPSGAAAKTGLRLVALGHAIGIGDSLPAFPVPGEQAAPALPTEDEPPAPDTTTSTGTETPPAATPTGDSSSSAGEQPLTGTAWLAAQSPSAYTLQLFALNGLEVVEKLLRDHPDLELRVIEFDDASPRYRVLYGVYATAEEAESSFRGLPEDVRREQPSPIVKQVAEIGAMAPAATPITAPSTPAAAAEPGTYTLQLFASNNRENVDKLVERYPALDLKIREVAESTSRYRVVYGAFDSEAEAKTASGALPATIINDTGQPLVRSLAELGGN